MNFDKIDNIFQDYLADQYFTGGVCYISVDGKSVFHKAYGFLDVQSKTPTKPSTIFDLASVTKIVTTTIILKMISESVLSLSTKLESCLPKTVHNRFLAPITIKQLLTHSSGLKAWHSFYAYPPGQTFFEILDQIDILHKEDNVVVYSDLNFMLLGEIIKHHFDNHLQGVVLDQLVKPFRLNTLTYNPVKKNIAATEFGNRIEKRMCRERNVHFANWRREDVAIMGEVNDGNSFYFFGGESGHAGLFSNVEDIVAIGELYLKGGINGGKEIISSSLAEESLTEHVGYRGLGWETSSIYPEGFGHTGFTGTALWIEPRRKIAVGLLTNRLNVDVPKNINSFRKEIFKEISNIIYVKGSYHV